jgi:hypothetical protein
MSSVSKPLSERGKKLTLICLNHEYLISVLYLYLNPKCSRHKALYYVKGTWIKTKAAAVSVKEIGLFSG